MAQEGAISSNEILSNEVGAVIGTGTTDLRITIARIIRVAFGLLGVIALLLILYAGFLWMTAAGDEEKVGRAKKTLSSAVIGLVIMLAAFSITSFIISRILGGDFGGGSGGDVSVPNDNDCIGLSSTCPAGALGNGIIESHYPARSATGIARNTRVALTFKEKVDPASLVMGPDGTIAILKSTSVTTASVFKTKFGASLTAAAIDIVPAGDGKTFVFMQKNCPTDCFGSPSESMWYTVALRGGSEGIKKANGAAAFTGTFNSGYLWDFQVSTQFDNTPPHVAYVAPDDKEDDVARNSIVQITFDEAVDPVSLNAGLSITHPPGTTTIAGTQLFGNAYRTLEFRSNNPCGTNSCGETVYCLPENQKISVTVQSDGLTKTPPLGVYPPTGVTDMAGNSLDGNGNGTAQGPTADDYPFSFTTGDKIDLEPPKVVSQNPAIRQGNIPRDAMIDATFNKLMSATSITTDSMKLLPPAAGGAPTNFAVTSDAVSSTPGAKPDQTKAKFQHDLLPINSPLYAANMTSAMRDLHQNCFFPGGGLTVCTGKDPFCCNGQGYLTASAAANACGFTP